MNAGRVGIYIYVYISICTYIYIRVSFSVGSYRSGESKEFGQ